MKKYLLFFVLISSWIYPQCNREVTITICDITTVDVDNNGVPDGILNLYDAFFAETGETIEPGTWFDPNFDFVLNPTTGDVLLWSLNEASKTENDYRYILYNTSCASTPALTINLVVGAFSGYALPPAGANAINYRVCATSDVCDEETSFNLLGGFQSSPAPHINGYWDYQGSSPNFIKIEGSRIFVDVPYQPGLPLVDEEVFELDYVVPDLVSCSGEQRTKVRVSVVRQASSGDSQLTQICEQDIINGVYDTDIKLSDDTYLIDEDLEGEWMGGTDTGNQIATSSDDIINIKELYEDLLTTNPRFGVKTFNFRYEVNHRSLVCDDIGSDIPFVIYESLRPFQQTENLILCIDKESPETINLLDEIEFTTENGVTYNYVPGDNAIWEFVSGPSTPFFTTEGEVVITGATMGDYVFRYTVTPEVNCDNNCANVAYESNGCLQTVTNANHLCTETESALVSFTLLQSLYPGENTSNIELCNEDETIDLISLLETNGTDVVYVGENGVWTDTENNIVPNDFVVPQIEDEQIFNFTYTTTNTIDCVKTASLSVTIYEEPKPGIGSAIEVCESADNFNLFDILTSDKNTNGVWTGPNGYNTTYLGEFNPAEHISGDYIYTVPSNGTCLEQKAMISVSISKGFYAGEDTTVASLCNNEETIDLISLLGTNGTDVIYIGEDGVWTDAENNIVLNDYVVPEVEGNQIFNFTYTTTNAIGCSNTASLSITVYEEPTAGIGSAIEICESADNFNLFDILTGDKNANGVWAGPNGYNANHLGVFNPAEHISGDYIYTVPSNGTCLAQQTVISVAIPAINYAGEDTMGATFCNDGATIDLISLLNTDGTNIVYRGVNGEWTNETGAIISNDYTIPDITGEQTFNFTYTTTNSNGCEDRATIIFNVVEAFSTGIGSSIEICATEASFNLFDILTGDKNMNGVWTGPNGYNATYLGAFNPAEHISGDYRYTIPANGTSSRICSCNCSISNKLCRRRYYRDNLL